MTKSQIREKIAEILEETDPANKEAFCAKHEIKAEAFYPYAFGYVDASLRFIMADGDVLKMSEMYE